LVSDLRPYGEEGPCLYINRPEIVRLKPIVEVKISSKERTKPFPLLDARFLDRRFELPRHVGHDVVDDLNYQLRLVAGASRQIFFSGIAIYLPLSASSKKTVAKQNTHDNYRIGTMELRNHPFLVCDGVHIWPPKWLPTFGPSRRTVMGEVGKLDQVFITSIVPPDKVYLGISTDDGNCYLGTLIFENATYAKAIFDIFNANLNKPISDIAAIDIPVDR
jgi:hypothetical protein